MIYELLFSVFNSIIFCLSSPFRFPPSLTLCCDVCLFPTTKTFIDFIVSGGKVCSGERLLYIIKSVLLFSLYTHIYYLSVSVMWFHKLLRCGVMCVNISLCAYLSFIWIFTFFSIYFFLLFSLILFIYTLTFPWRIQHRKPDWWWERSETSMGFSGCVSGGFSWSAFYWLFSISGLR